MPFDRGEAARLLHSRIGRRAGSQLCLSRSAERATVILDLRGVPYLTLWSDGGPFLCVEPCWGLTDHHEQRAFEDKEGIQQIAPGGELLRGIHDGADAGKIAPGAGSSGRIRTYDQSVNSRPLYH